jgi:hypothetical protein
MQRVILLLLMVAACLTAPSLFRRFTLGFVPGRVERPFPIHSGLNTPISQDVAKAMDQNFRLIGRGAQAYVFASEDDQYVLKLFIHGWKMTPQKIEALFRACQMVRDRLQEETGVLCIHLDPTELSLPVVACSDGIGRSWRFPLDKMRFVLQKKAKGFKATLCDAANRAEMEQRLAQFWDCVHARMAKGVVNRDKSVAANFGFLGDRAIEFDFGCYTDIPEFAPGEEEERFAASLRRWMKKELPEWAFLVDEHVSDSIRTDL